MALTNEQVGWLLLAPEPNNALVLLREWASSACYFGGATARTSRQGFNQPADQTHTHRCDRGVGMWRSGREGDPLGR